MKTHTTKPQAKTKISEALQKLIVKRSHVKKKLPLTKDPFFSSPPVDLGRTNNTIIDEILYGKNGA